MATLTLTRESIQKARGQHMNILALDAAPVTGWATNNHGRRSGVTEFSLKRGESPRMRFLRYRACLNEMWKLLGGQIDVICYEQAHIGAEQRRPAVLAW